MDMDITCITTDNNWYYLVDSFEWEHDHSLITSSPSYFLQCTKMGLVKTRRESGEYDRWEMNKRGWYALCIMHYASFHLWCKPESFFMKWLAQIEPMKAKTNNCELWVCETSKLPQQHNHSHPTQATPLSEK